MWVLVGCFKLRVKTTWAPTLLIVRRFAYSPKNAVPALAQRGVGLSTHSRPLLPRCTGSRILPSSQSSYLQAVPYGIYFVIVTVLWTDSYSQVAITWRTSMRAAARLQTPPPFKSKFKKADFVDKISTFLHGFTLQPTSLEYWKIKL